MRILEHKKSIFGQKYFFNTQNLLFQVLEKYLRKMKRLFQVLEKHLRKMPERLVPKTGKITPRFTQ